nr:acyl carrier protein [uncultured Caldimonas sp.]
MPDIKQQVRAYILDNFLMGAQGTSFGDADSFMEQHVLDSTGFLELITFLEETYSIKVDDEEMVPENLDSLDNVDAFVQRKLAGR